jgi:hypothetical protein
MRSIKLWLRRVAFGAFLWLAGSGAIYAQTGGLPIFDAHIHYGENAWRDHPPAEIFQRMDRAGVRAGLVSSSPDEGTLRLKELAADRVVAELRPYREGITSGNWLGHPSVLPFLRDRLACGAYVGIGEFHLHSVAERDRVFLAELIGLARAHNVFVHVHGDAQAISALYAIDPEVRVLWAHAGMSDPAAVVGDMLARHPTLLTEVSFRAHDIGSGGSIDPVWRDVLIRHRARILVGSDTYIPSRWAQYESLIAAHRAWLSALPRDIAEDIAYRNAERLFGIRVGAGN